jgi:hypothetical protein
LAAVLVGAVAVPEPDADPQTYSKPAYPAVPSDNCNPRKAPKCSENSTETFCLTDAEYPEKEIRVSPIFHINFILFFPDD